MKKLVFLTGAGMSAESGFSTFRDSDGLWERYPVEKVATPQGWSENPNLVTDFYNGLRKQLITAKPNHGHELVAQLESKFAVSVITQNVDDLHERAGSSHVVHLHGELMKACSSKDPDNPRCWVTLPNDSPEISHGSLAKDGSLLRPWIVWFGEAVPLLDAAAQLVEEADVFVIVGTSLNVYPAAGLVRFVQPNVPIYLIDPKPVAVPGSLNVTTIQTGASDGMQQLVDMLV